MIQAKSSNYKSFLPEEFRHYSRLGDNILNIATFSLFRKYNDDIHIELIHQLVSNEVISQFKIPMTFKFTKHRYICRKKVNGIKGDKVEFYIWFLFSNYGMKAVERYLISQYKDLLTKL